MKSHRLILPSLFVFFKILAILAPLFFYVHFRIILPIAIKILETLEEIVPQFAENWHFYNVESSNPWTQFVSPFNWNFLDFFCQHCLIISKQNLYKLKLHLCISLCVCAIVNNTVVFILVSMCSLLEYRYIICSFNFYIAPETLLNSLISSKKLVDSIRFSL